MWNTTIIIYHSLWASLSCGGDWCTGLRGGWCHWLLPAQQNHPQMLDNLSFPPEHLPQPASSWPHSGGGGHTCSCITVQGHALNWSYLVDLVKYLLLYHLKEEGGEMRWCAKWEHNKRMERHSPSLRHTVMHLFLPRYWHCSSGELSSKLIVWDINIHSLHWRERVYVQNILSIHRFGLLKRERGREKYRENGR